MSNSSFKLASISDYFDLISIEVVLQHTLMET